MGSFNKNYEKPQQYFRFSTVVKKNKKDKLFRSSQFLRTPLNETEPDRKKKNVF